jgi:ligand-binding SRPBCC domain-containing protein
MQTYTHSFCVRAGLLEVANFHRDASALKYLTPPPVVVQIHHVQALGEGSLAEFTMWMGPVPIRWLARHVDVNMPEGFTDIQEKGPFDAWKHRHRFVQISEHLTEVEDRVEAEPGSGFLNGLVSRLMWLSLPVLFAYRGWATRRLVEKR